MATAKAATPSKNANGATSAADIEQDIERIRGDIAALAGSLKRYGSDKTGEYKAKANAAGQDLTKLSQETLNDLTAELKACERVVSSKVRKHPLQAIGLAAGAGFLIAALARR